MKRILALILVLALCLPLCACGGEKGTVGKSDDKITTSSAAVRAVQNSSAVQNKIASVYGFKFYGIDWGTCTARWVEAGTSVKYWEVTLNGNIYGYKDDQKTDYKRTGFTRKVSIYESGYISSY